MIPRTPTDPCRGSCFSGLSRTSLSHWPSTRLMRELCGCSSSQEKKWQLLYPPCALPTISLPSPQRPLDIVDDQATTRACRNADLVTNKNPSLLRIHGRNNGVDYGQKSAYETLLPLIKCYPSLMETRMTISQTLLIRIR